MTGATPTRARPRRRRLGPVVAADWIALLLTTIIAAPPVSADGLFARGDANCDSRFTAADVVASVQALGGLPGCGNGDCDRDGSITVADPMCAATCLFGACAIPPNAPRIATVVADGTPAIVPVSAITITGANFGAADHLKRVTIGGVDAVVVSFDSPNTLEAIVPAGLPAGPADVVVYDGEVAGPPSTITVAAAMPSGSNDTFDGTLNLVDTTLGLMLALDLDSAFGAEAATLRQSLQQTRSDLATQRTALAADPNLTAAVRAQLNADFDSSGAPAMLRSVISDLQNLLAPAAPQRFQPAVVSPTIPLAIARAAGITRVAAAVVTTATAPFSLPVAAGIALLLGIATGVMIHFASGMPTAPVISAILSILDANQQPTQYAIPGGFLGLAINSPNPASTVLGIAETRGAHTIAPTSSDANQFLFPLPDPATGDFCGFVQLVAIDTSTHLGSPPVGIPVRPLLRGIDPHEGYIGERLDLDTSGVLGCLDRTQVEFYSEARTFLKNAMGDTRVYLPIPDITMADYGVSVAVDGLYSMNGLNDYGLLVKELLAPNISCQATKLAVPPTDPAVPPMDPVSTDCMVRPNPSNVPFPKGTSIIWESSDHSVGTLTPPTATSAPFGTRFDAYRPGTAAVTATYSHKDYMATTGTGISMTVADESPPMLMLSSSQGAGMIDPGSPITVTATAHDNVALSRIDVTATGDAIDGDMMQTFTCGISDPDCSDDFTFNLKSDGFTNNTVTITATAKDTADLTATSDPLTFTLKKDVLNPNVTIQSPADGATVDAGSTVQVTAMATDNQPDDTGVKSFTYSASGDALVAGVQQTITFPNALPTASLKFSFTVKKAEDLVSVIDKTIDVTVEATDDARNTSLEQTLSLTAVAMLPQCSGAISTDNPSDCDGKLFTITVVLTGDAAAKVTRVTSINPGGQFDLVPQGGGVYTVTLAYEGTGSFTLTFYAFDADGKGLCSNSIDLNATGPCPDSGTAGAAASHGR